MTTPPNKKQTEKKIRAASKKVMKEIADTASSGGLYAKGRASEGYTSGYNAALQDVLLVMGGVKPCIKPKFWE